jgi:hypothetical protein
MRILIKDPIEKCLNSGDLIDNCFLLKDENETWLICEGQS